MLSKEVFKKGIDEIGESFIGFEITKKRAGIWYKYCQDLADSKFLYRVKNCIKGCRRIPTLADILDWKNYYVNTKEEADIQARREEREYELRMKRERKERETNGGGVSPIPEEAKKIFQRVKEKRNV